VRPVQQDLIEWWSSEGRDLPWRRSRDPWAVLVSELMLQQTQVARVTDRYERDIGLVDTNAGRFVARALVGRPLGPTEAQDAADAAVPDGWGWTWGQAVFDLGAGVCRKRAPRCDDCPIRAHCAWASAGFPEPDPITGSAGISTPQSRFDGSDRQGRVRLVDALRTGPVAPGALATVMGWPDDPDRAQRVATTLVADGLAVTDDVGYRLP